MDNDELTEQEKREMELILYSLDKIAPFFKDDVLLFYGNQSLTCSSC